MTENAPGVVIIGPTTLDNHAWFRQVAQIFTRSALPWAQMPLQHTDEEELNETASLQRSFAAGSRPR